MTLNNIYSPSRILETMVKILIQLIYKIKIKQQQY